MSNLLLLGATNANHFCNDASEILKIVGWVLTIFKIAIPLIIIGLGLIDLGKAAISSKPEEIKKSATGLIWRFVGGIVIFFIPVIVMLVFGFVGGFNSITTDAEKSDWPVCYGCVTAPWGKDCTGAKPTYPSE